MCFSAPFSTVYPNPITLGFGGVVVLGDLWNRFNIHSTLDYKELINHFRTLRKAAD